MKLNKNKNEEPNFNFLTVNNSILMMSDLLLNNEIKMLFLYLMILPLQLSFENRKKILKIKLKEQNILSS